MFAAKVRSHGRDQMGFRDIDFGQLHAGTPILAD